MGPTCIGKTNLSIKLLDYLPCEIVSVDSCMVYKDMNIGTGKPSLYLLKKVKHHLIDICDPVENYTVFDFCRDSCLIIESCWKRGKIPLFVGGSMMYFWALYQYIFFLKNLYFFNSFRFGCSENLSFSFYKYYNLHYKLLDIFSDRKQILFDNMRLLRFFNIAIVPVDKYKLYNRIESRFYGMFKDGFIDEVFLLYSRKNLDLKCKSVRSIGYRDLWLYFDGKLSLYNAKKSILNSTINLSSQQLLWLKKWKDDLIFIEDRKDDMLSYLLNIIGRHVF